MLRVTGLFSSQLKIKHHILSIPSIRDQTAMITVYRISEEIATHHESQNEYKIVLRKDVQTSFQTAAS